MDNQYFRHSNVSPNSPKLKKSALAASSSDNLFVANLNTVSLEELIYAKLEHFFKNEEICNTKGLYKLVRNQFEKPLIKLVLKNCKYNQLKAASLLGLSRNTLKKKIEEYDLLNSR